LLTALSNPATQGRPRVEGKFICAGDRKLYLQGVTYGTFHLNNEGQEEYRPDVVVEDFLRMAASGVNAVRTYTVPPAWLLDAAQQAGLRVLVGLPWEQHIAFLDDPQRVRSIEARVRDGVRACARHSAVLGFAIGNEIPAPIVRWHGARRIEQFLERLYRLVKSEDPEALVTYVNYPTTEYLQLPFLDFVSFNVYLESPDRLDAYLARLHNLAGDRPLVMAEIGLDSRRSSEETQAAVLDWQVRTIFSSGAAGVFVFAWTDEWHRGGHPIEDWDFGLTRRDRTPKKALAVVQAAFKEVPFPSDARWPRVSVVVCTYNGASVIRDCLEGLSRLDYPNYEVLVVNDGSTDDTAAIVQEYPFRLISTENFGLSSARNTGMQAASGEIIAYTDDDARPDPSWLKYLAWTFMTSDYDGVGGPNIAPPGDGWFADCVANAPGGPVHVLLSDREAEHIPGCNMAFRRDALEAVGGCDVRFRSAGDDVDLCWRVQQRGSKLGFSPAAMVWHHRRQFLKTYWKQQQGYGRAEALLEAKWPEKYNATGHLNWAGRLYGKGLTQALFGRTRIYHGTWGSALFQSLYQPSQHPVGALPLMPEWYLLLTVLAVLGILGLAWQPLLVAVPLFMGALGLFVIQAAKSASKGLFTSSRATRWECFRLWGVTTLLHLLQPLARLKGRFKLGLTPWRNRGRRGFRLPRPQTFSVWTERWQSAEDRLVELEKRMAEAGVCTVRGGDCDPWDLEVRGGLLGGARLLLAVEEHGSNKQNARFRTWPKPSTLGVGVTGLFAVLFLVAAFGGGREGIMAGGALGLGALLLTARQLYEVGSALATLQTMLKHPDTASGGQIRTDEIPVPVGDRVPQSVASIDSAVSQAGLPSVSSVASGD
jgi:O-antigen biosynthesis protein